MFCMPVSHQACSPVKFLEQKCGCPPVREEERPVLPVLLRVKQVLRVDQGQVVGVQQQHLNKQAQASKGVPPEGRSQLSLSPCDCACRLPPGYPFCTSMLCLLVCTGLPGQSSWAAPHQRS